MKIIPTKLHGILDYAMGITLLLTSWLLPTNGEGYLAAQWVPATLGIMLIAMSLITNYELGLVKVLPMRAHLTMDFLHGLVLASSPWLFDFSDQVYIPHLALGITEMLAALLSSPVPYQRTARGNMDALAR
jgi:hypothetical protein